MSSEAAAQTIDRARYLTFTMGTERYAVPLLIVKEVIEMAEPTPIPHVPAFVKGVINLRGRVISIFDLRSKLQLPKADPGPKAAIVIVDLENVTIGVMVDRVSSVVAFKDDELSAAPAVNSGREHFLTGIARQGNSMTLLLDLESALGLNHVSERK